MRKLTVLLASILIATALYPQQTPVPTASETIEVRVTNIDVVVTDSAGNPATGLTADDFEVMERGRVRPITNFYEVRATPAAVTAGASAPVPAEAIDSGTSAHPATVARRRIIVYVDLFSVHPHQRTQMLDAFEKSLDRIMRPGDQAMLVTFNGISSDVLTPLTSDRAVLAAKLKEVAKRSGGNLAAEAQKSTILDNAEMLLERAKVQPPPPGPSDAPAPIGGSRTGASQSLTLEQAYSMARSPVASFAEQQYRKQKSLLSDLQRILGSLAGAEGKKVLLFLGGELVENPGLELFQRIDAIFAPHLQQVQPVATRDPSRNFAVDIRTLAETANANDVTMYMVDASSRGGGDNDAGTMSLRRAQSETMSLGETTRAMAQVADLTGGISVPAGKTIQTALDTIVRDLSSYYSLGYRSEEQGRGNLEVRVKKPGLRVRTRRTFDPATQLAALPPTAAATAPSPVVPPALAKASDALVRQRLLTNVFDDVPSDFPVTVTADDLRRQQDGKYRVTLNVAFPPSVTLTEHNGTMKGQVAVYIVTNNEDGEMSPVTATVKPLTVTAAERAAMSSQKPFSFTFPLVMQEGEVIVSVGVADQLGGTAGFAKTSVVAP